MRGFNPRDRLFQPDLQLECEGQRERTWYLRGIKPPLSGGGGRSYAFLPTDIPGLVDWHRSDLGITLVGSKVSAWADQSGNGRHLTQSTDARRPVYNTNSIGGNPAVDFGAITDDRFLAWTPWASTSTSTIFAVVRLRDSGQYQSFIHLSSGPDRYLMDLGNSDKPMIFAGGARALWSAPLVAGNLYLVKWATDIGGNPANFYTQVNGGTEVSEGVAGPVGSTNYTSLGLDPAIATDQDLISEVAELIIYSRRLAAAEEAMIRSYSQSRYGVGI